MTVRIAPARFPEDVEAVRAILREYAASLGFNLCFQGFAGELAGLPGAYAPPAGRCLLALDGPAVVGVVALREAGDGACEMKRLYIRPSARGGGLGGRMAEAVIAEARSIGYRAMRLDTVPEMATAQRLYEGLGFRDIPPYRANPVPGARYMELRL